MLRATRVSHARPVTNFSSSNDNLYVKLRQGYVPPVSKSRTELLSRYADELANHGILERDLLGKGARELGMLLLQLQFDKLFAVPFNLVTFDLEFTDIPRFTKDKGPTASIIEIGMYHPDSDTSFSRLVLPRAEHTLQDGAMAITGLTPAMVAKDGVDFPTAWRDALEWIRSRHKRPGDRQLLLSR